MKACELLVELVLDADTDDVEADQLRRRLRRELEPLDFESIRNGTAPAALDTAKGAAVDWYALILELGTAGGAITSIIALGRDWLGRNATAKRLKLTIDNDTIELERTSTNEREQLINAWIERHESVRPSPGPRQSVPPEPTTPVEKYTGDSSKLFTLSGKYCFTNT
jgi:hypothetical protein